jgi:hypothetical protein
MQGMCVSMLCVGPRRAGARCRVGAHENVAKFQRCTRSSSQRSKQQTHSRSCTIVQLLYAQALQTERHCTSDRRNRAHNRRSDRQHASAHSQQLSHARRRTVSSARRAHALVAESTHALVALALPPLSLACSFSLSPCPSLGTSTDTVVRTPSSFVFSSGTTASTRPKFASVMHSSVTSSGR